MSLGSWLKDAFKGSPPKKETIVEVFEYYSQQIMAACRKPKYIHNAEMNLLGLKRHVEMNVKDERKMKRILEFLSAVQVTMGNIKEKAAVHSRVIPYAFSRDIVMDIDNRKQKDSILADEYSRGRNEKLDITSVSDNLGRALQLFKRSL